MLSARPVRINTDGPPLPTKTPRRDLKTRLENANATATTLQSHNRGKNVVFPKTPLQPTTSAQSKRLLFKDQKSVLGTAPRPLGDKTPLPNRLGTLTLLQSPSEKIKASSKSNLHVTALPDSQIDADTDVPESMKRPSSLRKHLKLPRNSIQKNFETPINHGRHWDITDDDIDVSTKQPILQETNVEQNVCLDEIEYCAPNTLDLPYQPPFDFELPDYTEVGKKIRELAFSCPFDDTPAPLEPEFLVTELEPIQWEAFSLPPLESDDPFNLTRLESKKASTNKPSQETAHRRVQSSLARLGPSSSGITSRHKSSGPSSNSKKMAIPPEPLKKQPPKPVTGSTSKTTATRTAKSTTAQKTSTAAPVAQIRGRAIQAQTRPYTSLSLNKGTMSAPTSFNPQVPDHPAVDEDFLFDV